MANEIHDIVYPDTLIYIYIIHIIYILDAYIRRDSVWSVARRDGGGKGRVKIDEV